MTVEACPLLQDWNETDEARGCAVEQALADPQGGEEPAESRSREAVLGDDHQESTLETISLLSRPGLFWADLCFLIGGALYVWIAIWDLTSPISEGDDEFKMTASLMTSINCKNKGDKGGARDCSWNMIFDELADASIPHFPATESFHHCCIQADILHSLITSEQCPIFDFYNNLSMAAPILYVLNAVLEFQNAFIHHLHWDLAVSTIFGLAALFDMVGPLVYDDSQEQNVLLNYFPGTMAVHLYLIQATLAVGLANEPNILTKAGDFLFLLGSIIDVIISYLDVSSMALVHVRRIQVCSLVSASLWLLDAALYILVSMLDSRSNRTESIGDDDMEFGEFNIIMNLVLMEEEKRNHDEAEVVAKTMANAMIANLKKNCSLSTSACIVAHIWQFMLLGTIDVGDNMNDFAMSTDDDGETCCTISTHQLDMLLQRQALLVMLSGMLLHLRLLRFPWMHLNESVDDTTAIAENKPNSDQVLVLARQFLQGVAIQNSIAEDEPSDKIQHYHVKFQQACLDGLETLLWGYATYDVCCYGKLRELLTTSLEEVQERLQEALINIPKYHPLTLHEV